MDPLIDRAALGVTELLSNVHRHARPDKSCTVELELRPDRLTVSVRDNDPRLPVPVDTADTPDAGPLATCGRGLAMVAAVSESWGARPDGENGKIVWFTLPAPAAARTHPAGTPRGTTQTARPAPEPARVSAAVPAAAGASVAAGAPVPAAVPLSAGTPVAATAPVGSATSGATPAPTVVHASVASGVQTPARPAVSG